MSRPFATRAAPGFFWAAGIALLYGVWARILFQSPWEETVEVAFGTLTLAFCFLMPVGLGTLTVILSPAAYKTSWLYGLFAPWLPCLALGGVAILMAWEASICVVMAMPIFLVMSSVGGLITALLLRRRQSRLTQTSLFGVMVLLPYLIAPIETQLPPPDSIRTVETQIEIAAEATTVWDQVAAVPAISEAERPFSFFHRLGLPRPVEATLSGDGVGAVRYATFDNNLAFIETITEWQPEQRLTFDIVLDRSRPVPAPFYMLGGPHLDVFEGAFWIEPVAEDRVILHLTSRHRLSTNFNAYGGLWTDWIMHDLQMNILQVMKARSED